MGSLLLPSDTICLYSTYPVPPIQLTCSCRLWVFQFDRVIRELLSSQFGLRFVCIG